MENKFIHFAFSIVDALGKPILYDKDEYKVVPSFQPKEGPIYVMGSYGYLEESIAGSIESITFWIKPNGKGKVTVFAKRSDNNKNPFNLPNKGITTSEFKQFEAGVNDYITLPVN